MPQSNEPRRRALTDAAIALLAESGVHGVTHRAAEKAARLPPGTASNYFRSREALLIATAQRVGELHRADMDHAAREHTASTTETASVTSSRAGTAEQLIDLLSSSLLEAATTYRTRYLAIFELRLEALRRPALASALADLVDHSVRFTAGHHADLGLFIPPDRIPSLVTLYGGALFTLVTTPLQNVTENAARTAARTIVQGGLPDCGDS